MASARFNVFEATIGELHAAIRGRRTTVADVVRQHIERVRAFNGPSSALVTKTGGRVPAANGVVRGGAPIKFPTETVAASSLLPDLNKYCGPPLEFGRMEPTASMPSVSQQSGMIVGLPNAGQVNALSTLNIRGERSVTCWGEYDRQPSDGPLPDGAPAVCEHFRAYPDALEQAAAYDALYGSSPDLKAMPLYGVCFSLKDPFDAKDLRSTGGADAAYDIDVPARDHPLVARLRQAGAIILAKANCTEYNAAGLIGDPGGEHKPASALPSTLGYQRSTWGGNPSNPYDTARSASLGSSSGSAVSVATSMVMASLGEETRASCRGPANHNAVSLILPHKGMLPYLNGGVGADIFCDRPGILARNLADCATILDALLMTTDGDAEAAEEAAGAAGHRYYDARDPFTTVPRASVLPSYSRHVASGGGEEGAPPPPLAGLLSGRRIGVLRESMVRPPGSMAEVAIIDAACNELEQVLGGTLGATLVESTDPLWEPTSKVEAMALDYPTALARLVAIFMPDLLFRLNPDGSPLFADVAAAVKPTEFAPGVVFGHGSLDAIDYCARLAEGSLPPPANLSVASVQPVIMAHTFHLHVAQYLARRRDDWAALGFTETLDGWDALNERSKFWADGLRAAFLNWGDVTDPRNPLGSRQGVSERIVLRELLRRADMAVLLENQLDVLVRLHSPWPPGLIGHPYQRDTPQQLTLESFFGPNAGLTEVLVPAGFVREAYDPTFVLSADGTCYVARAAEAPTLLPAPGLPFSLVFRGEPGKEDAVLEVASAYEAASRRRVPPPDFGPL